MIKRDYQIILLNPIISEIGTLRLCIPIVETRKLINALTSRVITVVDNRSEVSVHALHHKQVGFGLQHTCMSAVHCIVGHSMKVPLFLGSTSPS